MTTKTDTVLSLAFTIVAAIALAAIASFVPTTAGYLYFLWTLLALLAAGCFCGLVILFLWKR